MRSKALICFIMVILDILSTMEDKYPKINNLNQVIEDHAEEYIHLLQKLGQYNKKIT